MGEKKVKGGFLAGLKKAVTGEEDGRGYEERKAIKARPDAHIILIVVLLAILMSVGGGRELYQAENGSTSWRHLSCRHEYVNRFSPV